MRSLGKSEREKVTACQRNSTGAPEPAVVVRAAAAACSRHPWERAGMSSESSGSPTSTWHILKFGEGTGKRRELALRDARRRFVACGGDAPWDAGG